MDIREQLAKVSRWANRTLFGGENETVSSRLGKLEARGVWWATVACWLIGVTLLDTKHCQDAIEEPLP